MSWMKVEKPGDIVLTLAVSMKLSEWEMLGEQLKHRSLDWPAMDFIREIQEMGAKARKEFYPSE